MFMSPSALVFLGVAPRGVLHVGAHEGEESALYASKRWGPVTWVEMLPDKAEFLRRKFDGDPVNNAVIEAACWDSETELTIQRGMGGTAAQASSLLLPGSVLTLHPEISFEPGITVETRRLDTLLPPDFGFELVNVDTQGAELRVLRGLGERLSAVRWAYIEINEEEVYQGAALLPEIDAFLSRHGLFRVARIMCGRAGWGDALYVRIKDLTPFQRLELRLKSQIYYFWGKFRWPESMRDWDNCSF